MVSYYWLGYIYTYGAAASQPTRGGGKPAAARGQLRQASTPQAAASRPTNIIISSSTRLMINSLAVVRMLLYIDPVAGVFLLC